MEVTFRRKAFHVMCSFDTWPLCQTISEVMAICTAQLLINEVFLEKGLAVESSRLFVEYEHCLCLVLVPTLKKAIYKIFERQ